MTRIASSRCALNPTRSPCDIISISCNHLSDAIPTRRSLREFKGQHQCRTSRSDSRTEKDKFVTLKMFSSNYKFLHFLTPPHTEYWAFSLRKFADSRKINIFRYFVFEMCSKLGENSTKIVGDVTEFFIPSKNNLLRRKLFWFIYIHGFLMNLYKFLRFFFFWILKIKSFRCCARWWFGVMENDCRNLVPFSLFPFFSFLKEIMRSSWRDRFLSQKKHETVAVRKLLLYLIQLYLKDGEFFGSINGEAKV